MKHYLLICTVLVSVFCRCDSLRAEILDDVVSYRVLVGTLEMKGAEFYVFRSGKFVENFDVSLFYISGHDGEVRGGGVRDITGLVEIGMRTQDGILYLYREVMGLRGKVLEKMKKERPKDKVKSLVFLGDGDHIFEMNVRGQTKVSRMDIQLKNGTKGILWSNIPEAKQDDRRPPY